MPSKSTTRVAPAKTTRAPKARNARAPRTRGPVPAAPKSKAAPMTVDGVMATLKAAGSEQARRTYARHGAPEPMFGVRFATLAVLMKQIGVDHALASSLWRTGNFDARNLAMKIADPAKMSAQELTRWAREAQTGMILGYIAQLAAETPHAKSVLTTWMAKKGAPERITGWRLIASIAMLDDTLPDSWFTARLAEIERTIHAAPNRERAAMNHGVIGIGCHNPALRKAAVAAAGGIGAVEVDHGDTACETPAASDSIKKARERSASRGFPTPAAHERSMGSARLRC